MLDDQYNEAIDKMEWAACEKCGDLNSKQALVCTMCGSRLPWAAGAVSPGQTPAQESVVNNSASRASNKSPNAPRARVNLSPGELFSNLSGRTLAITGSLVVVLLIGFLASKTLFKPKPTFRVAPPDPEESRVPDPNFVAAPPDASGSTNYVPPPPVSSGSGSVPVNNLEPRNLRTVTYHVTGRASNVTLEFVGGTGPDTYTPARLPWSRSYTFRSGNTVYLKAKVQGEGSVVIYINVDGQNYPGRTAQGQNAEAYVSGKV